MATVFRLNGKCFCGGRFGDNTKSGGDFEPGTFLKCSKCNRQAIDPDLVQAYKKKQAKKGASQ